MITWNPETGNYYDDGTLITREKVRRLVDQFAAALALIFAGRARALHEAWLNITSDQATFNAAFLEWMNKTREDIKAANLGAAIVGFGGLNSISETQFDRTDQFIAFQLGFWDAFVNGIVAGSITLDGRFAARTGLYGMAIYVTFEQAVRVWETDNGATEERRVLGVADHCTDKAGVPGCIEQAALDWQPIGTLRNIGECVCQMQCRCFFEFR